MSVVFPTLLSPPIPIPGLSAAAAAAVTGVPMSALAAPLRGSAVAARARQLAVYLHHVALGATITACSEQFGRDRPRCGMPAP